MPAHIHEQEQQPRGKQETGQTQDGCNKGDEWGGANWCMAKLLGYDSLLPTGLT